MAVNKINMASGVNGRQQTEGFVAVRATAFTRLVSLRGRIITQERVVR